MTYTKLPGDEFKIEFNDKEYVVSVEYVSVVDRNGYQRVIEWWPAFAGNMPIPRDQQAFYRDKLDEEFVISSLEAWIN